MPSPSDWSWEAPATTTFSCDQSLRHAELVRGVVDADVEGLLGRALISPLLSHTGNRVPRPAASTTRSARTNSGSPPAIDGVQQHAGHPLPRRGRTAARATERAARSRRCRCLGPACAELPFQVRPAGHVGGELVAQGVAGARAHGRRRRSGCSPAGSPASARPRPPCRRAGRGTASSNSIAPRAISRCTCRSCGTVARFAGRARQFVALEDA